MGKLKDTSDVQYKKKPDAVQDDMTRQLAAMEQIPAPPAPPEMPVPEQVQIPTQGLWAGDTAPDPMQKYLQKPVFTALQWVLDKLLTGEQVTGAAYRHYQQGREGKDERIYPEQEFSGYGDAMLKGLTHKTEWDWTDIVRTEDWYGHTYHGKMLHDNIAKFTAMADDESLPAEQRIEAAKAAKRAQRDLDPYRFACGPSVFECIAVIPVVPMVIAEVVVAAEGLHQPREKILNQRLLIGHRHVLLLLQLIRESVVAGP